MGAFHGRDVAQVFALCLVWPLDGSVATVAVGAAQHHAGVGVHGAVVAGGCVVLVTAFAAL